MSHRVFRSTAHPDTASLAAVYARAVVRPVAACMLPLMVVTLVDVLQGLPVLRYLVFAYPVALGVAGIVAAFRIRTTPAEIHVAPDSAAVRTVWECLVTAPLRPAPVVDLRRTKDGFVVAIGHTTYEERDRHWPDVDALLDALTTARHAPYLI